MRELTKEHQNLGQIQYESPNDDKSIVKLSLVMITNKKILHCLSRMKRMKFLSKLFQDAYSMTFNRIFYV